MAGRYRWSQYRSSMPATVIHFHPWQPVLYICGLLSTAAPPSQVKTPLMVHLAVFLEIAKSEKRLFKFNLDSFVSWLWLNRFSWGQQLFLSVCEVTNRRIPSHHRMFAHDATPWAWSSTGKPCSFFHHCFCGFLSSAVLLSGCSYGYDSARSADAYSRFTFFFAIFSWFGQFLKATGFIISFRFKIVDHSTLSSDPNESLAIFKMKSNERLQWAI